MRPDRGPTGPAREAPPVHLVELEGVRRHLDLVLPGCAIEAVEVRRGLPCDIPLADLRDRLEGGVVRRCDRWGRELRLEVGGQVLGMSVRPGAAICVGNEDLAPPPRPWLGLRFPTARLWLYGHRTDLAVRLGREGEPLAPREGGVEPLSATFTLAGFKRILEGRTRSIHALLVDDELIAGVGALYADEVLFAARLRPTRPVPSLGEEEVRLLYYSILEVLQKAIRFGGVGAEGVALVQGRPGTFRRFLAVHDRESGECPTCRTRIRAVTSGALRATFCPRCQP